MEVFTNSDTEWVRMSDVRATIRYFEENAKQITSVIEVVYLYSGEDGNNPFGIFTSPELADAAIEAAMATGEYNGAEFIIETMPLNTWAGQNKT